MTTQVIGGAAQGAEAGYKVGGGWGAAIGAVVGGIGGAFGDKAAKYRRKATAAEQRAADIKESTARRQLVRDIYLARSTALNAGATQESGGQQSSGVQGALSSIGTQGIYNLKYFDSQVAANIMERYYGKKAETNQGYSDFIMGIIQGINGGSGMGGGMMGGGGSKSGSSSSGSSGSSGASWSSAAASYGG